MSNQKVIYIWDENLIEHCNRLPAVQDRAIMVHELIHSYNLFQHLKVVKSKPASINDLLLFHSKLYLEHLKSLEEVNSDYVSSKQDEEFGIGYDCPPVSNMFDLVCAIAGGSITAAKCLVLGAADVCINWCGGWHHANRSGAEGFCYVNDIVLAIETLRRKFNKILYVDLDVHHGNGVQDAYYQSRSVFTLSFHKSEPGFYPGTGLIEDIGSQQGRGYSCNVPLYAGYCDKSMEFIFTKVWTTVYNYFQPDAIVVQCGADALAHDPYGGANLSDKSYCTCIRMILDKRKPTLLLGGGGYNHANAAKLWTSLTALVAGVQVDSNIPDNDYWTEYGPDYVLQVEPTLARDMNKHNYLEDIVVKIEETFSKEGEMKVSEVPCNEEIHRKKVPVYKTQESNDNNLKDFKNIANIYDFVE